MKQAGEKMNWEKRERKDFRIKCKCYYCGKKFKDWNGVERHMCKSCMTERIVFSVVVCVFVTTFLVFCISIFIGGGN